MSWYLRYTMMPYASPSPLAFAMVIQLGFLHAVIQQPQAVFLTSRHWHCGVGVVFSWAFRQPGLEKKPLDPRKANVNLSSPLELLEPGENPGAGRRFSKMCCDKTSKKCGKSWKRKCDSLTTYYFFGRQHRGFKVSVAQYLVKIDQSKFCSNGFKDSIRCVMVFFPKMVAFFSILGLARIGSMSLTENLTRLLGLRTSWAPARSQA